MNWTERALERLEETKAKLGKRKGPNIIWLKEYGDDSKLRVCDRNLANGIPTLSCTLNDFEEGIACLAGRPNSGKSTILVNMITQSLDLNDNLMVIDLSLDDPYKKRYEQYIASLTGLHYQEITTHSDLSETKKELRDAAHNKLIKWYTEDRLRTIESVEHIKGDDTFPEGKTISYRKFENVFQLIRQAREQYPERKIILVVDAWNNLDPGQGKGSELNQTNQQLATLQQVSNYNEVMVLVSAHLRKTIDKRPGLEDIKGTSDMSYNVVWAGIVRNDFRENPSKAITYVEQGRHYPLIVVETAKTKVSGWDMNLYYGLKSGQCTIIPLNQAEYQNFNDQYMGR